MSSAGLSNTPPDLTPRAPGLDLLRLDGSFPSFMPDGRSLAFISYPGMSGVSAVGLDGAAPRLLAEARPRWARGPRPRPAP
jgi:hypothetical protein